MFRLEGDFWRVFEGGLGRIFNVVLVVDELWRDKGFVEVGVDKRGGLGGFGGFGVGGWV